MCGFHLHAHVSKWPPPWDLLSAPCVPNVRLLPAVGMHYLHATGCAPRGDGMCCNWKMFAVWGVSHGLLLLHPCFTVQTLLLLGSAHSARLDCCCSPHVRYLVG